MDRPVAGRIHRREGADAVHEASDDRHIQRMGIAVVEPPDGPGLQGAIKRPDGDGAVGAGRDVKDVVLDVARAAEDPAHGAGAGEGFPVG